MSAFHLPESSQNFVACNVAASTDREGTPQVNLDGVPLWDVRVVTLPDAEPGRDRVPMPEVLRVQLPAPKMPEVTFGQPVVFAELMVRTWSARDGRQGLMYQAAGVRTKTTTTAGSITAASATSTPAAPSSR